MAILASRGVTSVLKIFLFGRFDRRPPCRKIMCHDHLEEVLNTFRLGIIYHVTFATGSLMRDIQKKRKEKEIKEKGY